LKSLFAVYCQSFPEKAYQTRKCYPRYKISSYPPNIYGKILGKPLKYSLPRDGAPVTITEDRVTRD